MSFQCRDVKTQIMLPVSNAANDLLILTVEATARLRWQNWIFVFVVRKKDMDGDNPSILLLSVVSVF